MLRRWALLGLVLLPLSAGAVDTPPPNWQDCAIDDNCVVVKGPCHGVAVNSGIADKATAFYARQPRDTDCKDKFWEPKSSEADARCRLGRCEIVGKEK